MLALLAKKRGAVLALLAKKRGAVLARDVHWVALSPAPRSGDNRYVWAPAGKRVLALVVTAIVFPTCALLSGVPTAVPAAALARRMSEPPSGVVPAASSVITWQAGPPHSVSVPSPGSSVAGIASTYRGGGYWVTSSAGGVFSYGDAAFHGSLPSHGIVPRAPIVGIAADPMTNGYWLVGADGGVYGFDAAFHGSSAAAGGPIWSDPPPGSSTVATAVGIVASVSGYRTAYASEPSPLGGAVASYLASRVGFDTAAVYDATTGQTFVINPSLAELTASIVKVDILATALWQAQAAGRFLTPGEQALAVPMIEQSDNAAATGLWDVVGGASAVSAFDNVVGMSNTVPNLAWGLTSTTALDQVSLLRNIGYPSLLLSSGSRSYELSLMQSVTPSQAWGVSAGVAPGVEIALKNGWLPLAGGDWQVNSDGIVSGDGADYVISVLTTGDPSMGYGIQSISELSSLVWQALGG